MEKPLDIVLTHSVFQGQFQKQDHALEVFDDEIVAQDDEKLFLDLQKPISDQKFYSCQRPLKPQDGLLHYYSKDHGKITYTDPQTKEQVVDSKIQMLCCVTMYNEDKSFLERTLKGIQENLPNFQKEGVSPEQIAVVVMQDGLEKVNDTIVTGIFDPIDKEQGFLDDSAYSNQEDIITKNKFINAYKRFYGYNREVEREFEILKTRTFRARLEQIKKAKAILAQKYKDKIPEYLNKNQNFPKNIPKKVAQLYQCKYDVLEDGKTPPLTVFFCNKHLNGKKLHSHMWFFEGFCRQLQPKYVSLIDCGTQPDQYGLVEYFKAMEADKQIGGCSGLMRTFFNYDLQSDVDDLKVQKTDCEKQINSTTNIKEKGKLAIKIKKIEDNIQKLEQEIENNKPIQKRYSSSFVKDYVRSIFTWVGSKDDETRARIKRSTNQKFEKEKEDRKRRLFGDNMENEEKYKQKPKKRQTYTCKYINPFYFYEKITDFFLIVFLKFHLFFSITKAQSFEYDISQILDKNFESFFNFLQVLPGAWSAYRYEALCNTQRFKENILQKKYLKELLNPGQDLDIEETNMNLAEDRILCLGIFSQEKKDWILKYIPTAKAKTDAIDTLIEFMLQRRRWINSTFFAQTFVLRNYRRHISKSSHNCIRKYFGIPFMMFMSYISQMNSYLLIGFYAFMIHSCISVFQPVMIKNGWPDVFLMFPSALLLIYVLIVILLIFLSLNYKINKMNDNYKHYSFVNGVFGLYNLCILALIFTSIFKKYILQEEFLLSESQQENTEESDNIKLAVIIMVFISIGAIPIMMFSQLIECSRESIKLVGAMILSSFSYMYYTATYTHTLLIYAFCNIDDCTWGNKGADSGKKKEDFVDKKNLFIAKWMFWNSFTCYFLIALNQYLGEDRGYILIGIGAYGTLILAIKFVFAFFHHMNFYLFKRCSYKSRIQKLKSHYMKMGEYMNKQLHEDTQREYMKEKRKQQVENKQKSFINFQKFNPGLASKYKNEQQQSMDQDTGRFGGSQQNYSINNVPQIPQHIIQQIK